jgi:hypothetical protein
MSAIRDVRILLISVKEEKSGRKEGKSCNEYPGKERSVGGNKMRNKECNAPSSAIQAETEKKKDSGRAGKKG